MNYRNKTLGFLFVGAIGAVSVAHGMDGAGFLAKIDVPVVGNEALAQRVFAIVYTGTLQAMRCVMSEAISEPNFPYTHELRQALLDGTIRSECGYTLIEALQTRQDLGDDITRLIDQIQRLQKAQEQRRATRVAAATKAGVSVDCVAVGDVAKATRS